MFCLKVCTVLSSAQCMAKDVGQGSDMQGTPPRDLRGFRIFFRFCLCSYLCVYNMGVFVCSCLGIRICVTQNRHICPCKPHILFNFPRDDCSQQQIWDLKRQLRQALRDLSSKKWSVLLQLLIFLSRVPAECLLASANSGLTGPAVCCSS